ncbi:hypothetical protein [Sporosarcina koreensis]|nr:hypothetical protein [Sporosarcina koreensis]
MKDLTIAIALRIMLTAISFPSSIRKTKENIKLAEKHIKSHFLLF